MLNSSSSKSDQQYLHPAVLSLEKFLHEIYEQQFDQAYELVSNHAKIHGDSTIDIIVTNETFLTDLYFNEEEMEELRRAIPGEIAQRDKVTTQGVPLSALPGLPTPSEVKLFQQLTNQDNVSKCGNYTINSKKILSDNEVEISLTLQSKNGMIDNDTAIMVKEDDSWFVANPMHIIR
jgi:hypothetical protein